MFHFTGAETKNKFFENTSENVTLMHSIEEKKIKELQASGTDEKTRSALEQRLMRVYSDESSDNSNPSPFWNLGAQLVSLHCMTGLDSIQ